ncbi:hypothetical protein L3X07_05130 [Levilactobacillus brevis]|nr:hypothetical protein [Levilactobacillus brevis]
MNDNPLNILHTIGLKALYPVIRCQLKLAGQLDVSRLIQAVNLTAKVVPELFCRYELADNSWRQWSLTPQHLYKKCRLMRR